MRSEKRLNILRGFDFNILDDPEFQEDSVREEIIVPIITTTFHMTSTF